MAEDKLTKKERDAKNRLVYAQIRLELARIEYENGKVLREHLRETYDPNYPVYY